MTWLQTIRQPIVGQAIRIVLKMGLQSVARPLSRAEWLRPSLHAAYGWVIQRRSWMRSHPFDTTYGVLTAGYVPWWLLGEAGHARESNLGYGGCQPSCLRRALSTITDQKQYTFLDLGCGKGRGLIVASEFPFQHVTGIEIDAALCRICRTNAAAIRLRFPTRPVFEVLEGDATVLALPPGNLVVFIYHAFGLELFQHLVERLMTTAESRSLFVIYQNPVFGHVLDRESKMRRWFAETVACEVDERGVGSGESETVVCWVSRDYAAKSRQGAEAPIVVKQQSAILGNSN